MGNPQFRFTLSHDTRASLAALPLWVNQGSGTTWVTGANPQVSTSKPLFAPDESSKNLIGQITNGFPGSFTITYNLHVIRTSGTGTFKELVYIKLFDDAYAELATTTLTYLTEGTQTGSVVLTTTGYPKYVAVSTTITLFSGKAVSVDLVSMALSSGILTTKSISEPDGWKDAKLILERHEQFHSLVEYFEGGFIFYGTNGVDDGGIDFIKSIDSTFGADANIGFLSELSFNDGAVWEEVFTGVLDLSLKQELQNNKAHVPVVQKSFWTRFIAHLDTPVDLRSTTDIYGNPIAPVELVNINLTSQKLRQQYDAYLDRTAGYPGLSGIEITSTTDTYVQFDWNIENKKEINEKYSIPIDSNPAFPANIFKVEYGGGYQIDSVIDARHNMAVPAATVPGTYLDIYLKINKQGTAIAFTKTAVAHTLGTNITRYTLGASLTLYPGDEIYIYGVRSDTTKLFKIQYQNLETTPDLIQFYNYIRITANTQFASSEAQGFLLHDALAGVIARITGQ